MRKIKVRRDANEQLNTVAVLRLVTNTSPQKAIGVDEMRKRVRILDAIDALPDDAEFLQLEDDDVKTLSQAIEAFPWSAASRSLLTIIDDVLKAEQVPPPVKLVKDS